MIAFLKKQEANGRYFSKAMQSDRQSLSIPLRGRALCEAYAGALYRCYQNASMCYDKGILLTAYLQRQLTERIVMFLAIYHCSVRIIGRSKGKSVIAAATYRSGEKLCDRENGKSCGPYR